MEHQGLGDLLKSRFEGGLTYVVKCLGCLSESRRKGRWTELELALSHAEGKSGTELEGALGRYLGVEKLEGDNAYACERCGGKQEAQRWVELGDEEMPGGGLPPVGFASHSVEKAPLITTNHKGPQLPTASLHLRPLFRK